MVPEKVKATKIVAALTIAIVSIVGQQISVKNGSAISPLLVGADTLTVQVGRHSDLYAFPQFNGQ